VSEQLILEIIGYVASVLVAVSLMMSSILRLRVINLAGAVVFTVYGLLITAYPVAVVNAFIVLVNIYYLQQYFRSRAFFKLLEVRADSDYLRYFLSFHADDIQRFIPGFAPAPADHHLILFVLRDLVPAGLFIAEQRDEHTLEVKLDFVIPQYRDMKVGRYLFEEQAAFFRNRGIARVVSPPGSVAHAAYLEKMGFEPASGEGGQEYRLAIG
jgi:GNAT superfamily N-acetyltransferase